MVFGWPPVDNRQINRFGSIFFKTRGERRLEALISKGERTNFGELRRNAYQIGGLR